MTGAQASTGIDMARGAQLAVDQINGAGGLHGVQLTVMKVDDKAIAAAGLAAARKVIAAHAFAVVGRSTPLSVSPICPSTEGPVCRSCVSPRV